MWDNVCHHCDNPSNPNLNLGALVMDGGAGSTAYFYNNTVYSSKSNGIIARSGTLIATNNVVMSSNTVSPCTFADFAAAGGATLTQSYNVSSDGSASGHRQQDRQDHLRHLLREHDGGLRGSPLDRLTRTPCGPVTVPISATTPICPSPPTSTWDPGM